MAVVLKLTTGNKYDAITILNWLFESKNKLTCGNWKWSDFRNFREMLFEWDTALQNLYRILNEFNTLRARGEYWELYSSEEWIGVQLSPYKGNVIISFVMTDKRYELWQTKLWLKLSELTSQHKLKTAYLCDAEDFWFELKKKRDGRIEMEVEELSLEKQNPIKVRQQKLRDGYGQVLELDDIFYPSCWTMWFYDLGASMLPQIADFKCFHNDPCGRGRFVQLYEKRTDFELPESRAVQRAFGEESGVDRKAEEMLLWLEARKRK